MKKVILRPTQVVSLGVSANFLFVLRQLQTRTKVKEIVEDHKEFRRTRSCCWHRKSLAAQQVLFSYMLLYVSSDL